MGRKKGNAAMPQDSLEQLLNAIHQRTTETRWGIGTAAHYLKSAEPYVAGVGCTPAQWQKAIKEAEKQLTWCDEEMCDTDLISKSYSDGTDLPDGFCGQFECTVTSNRKDRDGDVLEPAGFVLDPKSACLWQHTPFHPMGRVLKETLHDDERIKALVGIADTAFGRDNAILVKTGCVRISQGFKPFEFEPITHKDASDGVPKGWRIKRGEIREVSLVSIPSNVDAIITNFSQGKFASEEVKRWAKSYYDNRPTVVPVKIDLQVKVNGQELNSKAKPQKFDASTESYEDDAEQDEITVYAKSKTEPEIEQSVEPAPETKQDEPQEVKSGKVLNAVNKAKLTQAKGLLDEVLATSMDKEDEDEMETDATTDVTTKESEVETKDSPALYGMSPFLEGSFEFIRFKLSETAADYVRSRGIDVGRDCWTDMVATFTDMAIVCVHEYGKDSYPCYRMSYQVADGMPSWTGEPQEVEIKPTVVEKLAAEALRAKESQLLVTKDAETEGVQGEQAQEETIESLAKRITVVALAKDDASEATKALESALRTLGDAVEVLKCEDVFESLWG